MARHEIPEMCETKEMAEALHVKEGTARKWACYGTGPIKPVRLGNRRKLLWLKSDIVAILAGEVDVLAEKSKAQNAQGANEQGDGNELQ